MIPEVYNLAVLGSTHNPIYNTSCTFLLGPQDTKIALQINTKSEEMSGPQLTSTCVIFDRPPPSNLWKPY